VEIWKYIEGYFMCVWDRTVCDPGNCGFHHRLLVLHSTKVPGEKKG
jgi:hypothetical protein